jgi:UDP-N-acetylglucosamine--N-acetylmuramyl-(pentapeptide) pyrophosphoryl-undecaprenol N-acetylglucosamine transferase
MTTIVCPHRWNLMTVTNSTKNFTATNSGAVRIIMAGGGTGGHLYPGLAVAEALREEIGPSLELVWAATPRAVDQRLLTKFGDNYIRQPVQPLQIKKIGKWWGFLRDWRKSCAFWKRDFLQNPPACVVALGGYAAGPAAYVAACEGIPVSLLNPDALPGLANRFLLKRSDLVFSQWKLADSYTKKIPGKVLPLGCPIRNTLFGRTREGGAAALGLDPNKQTLIVTGASLGARTINDAVLELLRDPAMRKAFSRSEGNWQILHLSGMEQADAVKKAYADLPDVSAKVLDYCDDMASVWAVADLAIARAGASTCAELTACGVPSLLMPYPFHRDLHQKANAEELVKVGAAYLINDEKDAAKNAASVKKALETLLYDTGSRKQMAAAAKNAGRPNAARDIAKEILTLVAAQSR